MTTSNQTGLTKSTDKKAAIELLELIRKVLTNWKKTEGWIRGGEYLVWSSITTGENIYTPSLLPKTANQLRQLSEKCGGWWLYKNDNPCETFVSLDEWLELYNQEIPL